MTIKSKKFTLADKIKCYENALQMYIVWPANSLGICSILRSEYRRCMKDGGIGVGYKSLGSKLFEKLFPEFVLYRPEDVLFGEYWFSSNERRIEVLEEIIAKLKKELSHNATAYKP